MPVLSPLIFTLMVKITVSGCESEPVTAASRMPSGPAVVGAETDLAATATIT